MFATTADAPTPCHVSTPPAPRSEHPGPKCNDGGYMRDPRPPPTGREPRPGISRNSRNRGHVGQASRSRARPLRAGGWGGARRADGRVGGSDTGRGACSLMRGATGCAAAREGREMRGNTGIGERGASPANMGTRFRPSYRPWPWAWARVRGRPGVGGWVKRLGDEFRYSGSR